MSNCNTCPSSGSCGKSESSCGISNNPQNNIKNVIAVMSGKGGVGKSTVSVLLAKELQRQGHNVGILDADITGPSIPRLLGVQNQRAMGYQDQILPVLTNDGIKTMSVNLLVESENQPAIWRGPMISSTIKQFWNDVLWEELDYLIIDMPPGTGDVALTVMQSLPINGIVMVSIPQDLVSMIVSKAVNMARQINIPILGVVQNMSYIECEGCTNEIRFYDGEDAEAFYKEMNLKQLGELPMNKGISRLAKTHTDEEHDRIRPAFEPIANKIVEGLQAEKGKKPFRMV